MENKFTPELIEKARQAQSVEELIVLAEANGITLTQDEAKAYFVQLSCNKSGELSDDELDNVSGGGCYYKDGRLVVTIGYHCKYFTCKYCHERFSKDHFCSAPTVEYIIKQCPNCQYKTNKGMRMLCNCPDNYKK